MMRIMQIPNQQAKPNSDLSHVMRIVGMASMLEIARHIAIEKNSMKCSGLLPIRKINMIFNISETLTDGF